MRGGAEQHRLLLEERSFFPVLENAINDVASLISFVTHDDQARLGRRNTIRPKVLGEALPCELDHAIRRGQDRLGRSIVAVERDDLCLRTKLLREIQDVADCGRSEGIDRLRVVTDHCEAAPTGFQRQQNR
jgi:hypothetical protein